MSDGLGQPSKQSGKDRWSFALLLVAVISVGAFGGYGLGQYVFSRWTGVAPSPAVRPEAVQQSLDRQLSAGAATSGSAAAPLARDSQPGQQAASGGASPQPGASSTRPAPAGGQTSPAEAAAQGGGGFSVQVGYFEVRANAETLASSLRQEGYPVQVIPAQTGGKTVFRVRVGPYGTRDEAVAAKQKLAPRWPGAFIP